MNLPKVFQNNNIKTNNMSQSIYQSEKDELVPYTKNSKNNTFLIEKKINDLFNSNNYVYKLKVLIKTDNEEKHETIIGRTQKYLITLDNKKIDISSILDIEEDN